VTRWDPKGRSYSPGSRIPTTPHDRRRALAPLDVTATLRGKNLLVVGGTGFLGKVLVGMLLARFPDVGHIFLMVRGKGKMSPKERFEQELWPTPCFDPLRERYPLEKLYEKLTPIPGDVVEPLAGIKPDVLAMLRARRIDCLLNVAGVVSFDPPLDEGLQVNAVGVLNLLELCRALAVPPATPAAKPALPFGDDAVNASFVGAVDSLMPAPSTTTVSPANAVPLLHTSTCYVAGGRTGTIWEDDPRVTPFPYAVDGEKRDALERGHWDPQRELDEGMAIAKHLRERAKDAQMQSQFLARAKAKLRDLDRPTTGEPLAQAIKKEHDKYIDDELGTAGMERAKHWGWPNTYTYTKSIGEQLLASSGQPFTIVRPAIVESSIEFPFRGWNEGINTSAPLIYLALNGHTKFPTRPGNVLDVIPVDMVCVGTILSAAALIRKEAAAVYQYGSADTNPLTLHRLTELVSLHNRRHRRALQRGNPLVNRAMARFGAVPYTPEVYNKVSAPMFAKVFDAVGDASRALKKTPVASVARTVEKQAAGLSKQAKTVDFILQTFIPFMAEYTYNFRCDNTRAEYSRLVEHDRARLKWTPDAIDWRDYIIDVHVRGLKKWVFPHLEAKLTKRPRAEDRYSDLVSFLDEVADREGNKVAVQKLVDGSDGKELRGVTYRDLRKRAWSAASMLAEAGVHPGAKVALVARNSPEWAIAFFGVLRAGASVVPLDPALDADELGRRMHDVGAEIAIVEDETRKTPTNAACFNLSDVVEDQGTGEIEVPEVWVRPDDVAVVAYTAQSTEKRAAKPVVLTHKNVTAVLASIAPLFKLSERDSGLSVLPLFHTFELTCGLLLPMLRGARVTYVDDVTAESLSEAFQIAGISAMIGVPQVWEELEEKIRADLENSGPFAEAAFQAGLFLNRTLGKALGINLGRVIFRPIHDRLGGRVRFLVSTGGPVPKKTADTFRALGIELKQGYGLTEAAPVLTMGDAKGQRPIPGVEVEIRDVREDGVGEIVARGEPVMHGILDEELTADALGDDGWLRTGDLGRIDKDGRITVVARDNEVITLASGRRVYPRAMEESLASVKGVDEVCVVGLPDGQGGERVACLVVAKQNGDVDGAAGHGGDLPAIEAAVSKAAKKLDEHERPSLIIAVHDALPRTSDRKVKRPEVLAMLVAEETRRTSSTSLATVDRSIAPSEVLAKDELSVVERAREPRLAAPGVRAQKKIASDEPVEVPVPVKDALKGVLGVMQRAFYQRGLDIEVEGQQHIPWNRQTIVVANHASHLDMGLVKTALGNYGKDIVALAAKDYFFEGKWRRTYFEQLTNLRPLDRDEAVSLRAAAALLESGRNVLIFPEGTRTSTGEMAAFKPAVTYLAMRHGIDILPVYLEGTYRSMPRGALVPKNRHVAARIGEPIAAASLIAAAEKAGMKTKHASGVAISVVQKSIEALRDRRHFDVAHTVNGAFGLVDASPNGANGHANGHANGENGESEAGRTLRDIFADLERRFQRDAVKEAANFYFTLGSGPEAKWTVQVSPDGCRIVNAKVDGLDCVVIKTDAKMFARIMRDHYAPDISEFLNGTIKTNQPELLAQFLSFFNL
jgi:long-chain acyl-CoA synthetase